MPKYESRINDRRLQICDSVSGAWDVYKYMYIEGNSKENNACFYSSKYVYRERKSTTWYYQLWSRLELHSSRFLATNGMGIDRVFFFILVWVCVCLFLKTLSFYMRTYAYTHACK